MMVLWAAALTAATAQEPGADCDARLASLEARVDALEGDAEQPPSLASTDGSLVVPPGAVRESLVSLTGPVDVYGTVTGEVVAVGGDVRLHPGARVEGDAVSLGGEVVQAEGAELLGAAVDLHNPDHRSTHERPEARSAHHAAWWMGLAGISVLVGGLWPRRVESAGRWIQQEPLRAGIYGFAISSTLLSLALVFAVTVIGLPVSAVLVMLLAVGWLVGFTALCRVLGAQVPGLRRSQGWVPVVAGLGAVALLGLLTSAAPLVVALLAMPAVGAAALSRLGSRDPVAPDPDPAALI
jgi:hypothetical protein